MTVDQCINDLSSQFNIKGIVNCDNYSTSLIGLYKKIQELHQVSYQSTDRLIFIITKDYYKNNAHCGVVLQSLQAMLNDIDISNFFVCVISSNKKIQSEYQWILDNVSTDKVPINIFVSEEHFDRLPVSGSVQVYSKLKKLNDLKVLENLSPRHKHLLFESDSFCMIPWTSLMIEPSSKVRPCCESSEVIGDCSKNSLRDLWNSDKIKQVRKTMLLGIKPASCQNCYTKEDLGRDTLRKTINRKFINHSDLIDVTKEDGHLETFHLNFLDARFNNLCNLSCRSCGPHASSSWHEPALYIGKIDKSVKALQIAGKNSHDIYEQVLEHIDTLERVYFAGGEPLMIEQFYKLVEALDYKGRHNVELVYNINMTKSSLSGKSVFELWKNFKNISIGASLDGEHQRGEYLRSGQKWNDVVAFRRKILQLRPDIDFYVSATTGIINALHLPDFHRSWVDQNLINPQDFNIQLLFTPDYLRVDSAPDYLKKLIKEKYQKHLEWLRPLDSLGRATFGFESILNTIDCDKKFNATEFWNNIEPLDRYYGQSLLTVFPELQNLPRN